MASTSLRTRHGRIGAWEAKPHTHPRGGVIVIQEIFGLNPHIRQVTDRLASHGFHAVAPALFDLVQPGMELGYDEAGVEKGRELVDKLGFNGALDGVRAAFDYLDGLGMRVASVGFCWGGTVAFLANTRFGLPGVSYYGGRTVPFLKERLKAPMLFHFGETDTIIPPEDVAAHREALPHSEMHVWPAGHGFNCDQRADYNHEVAGQAMSRTLTFLQRLFRTA
jgi:carboxymethylenebutenolidase